LATRKPAKRKRPAARKAKPAHKRPTARPAARAKPVRRARPAKKPKTRAARPDLRGGISHLARILAEAKRELASIGAQDIRTRHLPTAGDELNAIVGATEGATNAILDAVERIEKTANAAGGETGPAILADVTLIYEACNFQDLTGQRIAKVVSVLQEIDLTVAGLLATLGLPTSVPAGKPSAAVDTRTGEEALLNGPQMPDAAPNQADIDALFDKA
jgi:chemotaxis protein CheZ